MTDDVKAVDTPAVDTPETETPQFTAEEQKALDKGWKPKDQWEGAEDEWKPAKVFNEIGELKERISNQEHDLKKANKVMGLMKDHHLNVRAAAYSQAVADLKKQRTEALEAEDFKEAEKIKDRIEDIQVRFQTERPLPPQIEAEIQRNSATDVDPEYFAFTDRNPWYKPGGRDEMSKEADALGVAYKVNNPNWTFKEIAVEVEKKIRKLYPEKFQRPTNPVNEPGATRGTSSNTERVVLSAEEKEIARGFGLTDAEYAKELKGYKGR